VRRTSVQDSEFSAFTNALIDLDRVFSDDWTGYEVVLDRIVQVIQRATGAERCIIALLDAVPSRRPGCPRSFTPAGRGSERTLLFRGTWRSDDERLAKEWVCDSARLVPEDIYVQTSVTRLLDHGKIGIVDDLDFRDRFSLKELREAGAGHGMLSAASVAGGLISAVGGADRVLGFSLQTTSHHAQPVFYRNLALISEYLSAKLAHRLSWRARVLAAIPPLSDLEMEAHSLAQRHVEYEKISLVQNVKVNTIKKRVSDAREKLPQERQDRT
jgi:hypothetical protein